MEEETIFSRNNITVTTSRFMVHGQTYAMSGITSVKFHSRHKSNVFAIIVALIGAFLIVRGVTGWGVAFLIFAALIYYFGKGRYSVMLTTAAGETEALKSSDQNLIQGVVSALNTAIVKRG